MNRDDRGGRSGAGGSGRGGPLVAAVPPARIRRSSGARRVLTPLPDGRRAAESIPSLWEVVGRAFPPWKKELVGRWKTLVGEPIAAHARPGLMEGPDGRTLIVFVDHPVWQFEIERRLRDLKDRIRQAVPSAPVERVAFRQDPGHADAAADSESD